MTPMSLTTQKRKTTTHLAAINTMLGKMTSYNHKQCTRRLRAGVFVDSSYMGSHCYFGYLTHPALEFDFAVCLHFDEVQRFGNFNKLLLSKEGDVKYRFGILTPTQDKAKVECYTVKAFIDGKIRHLFIYQSQLDEMIYKGHAINVTQESLFFENLVNL